MTEKPEDMEGAADAGLVASEIDRNLAEKEKLEAERDEIKARLKWTSPTTLIRTLVGAVVAGAIFAGSWFWLLNPIARRESTIAALDAQTTASEAALQESINAERTRTLALRIAGLERRDSTSTMREAQLQAQTLRLMTELELARQNAEERGDSIQALGAIQARTNALATEIEESQQLQELMRNAGRWVDRFAVDTEAPRPAIFDDYFIMISSSCTGTMPEGIIVTGDEWDNSTNPWWRVVFGYTRVSGRTAITLSRLTHLGSEWRSEWADWSAALFREAGCSPSDYTFVDELAAGPQLNPGL